MAGLSAYVAKLCSEVSMVIQKPAYSENDHFNLKFNVSISICWTFLNYKFLNFSLLALRSSPLCF